MTMTTTTTTTPFNLRPITYPLSPGVGWCSVLNQTDARKCEVPPAICRDYWLVNSFGYRESVAVFLCATHIGTRVRASMSPRWYGDRLQLRGVHDVKRPLPSRPGDPCRREGCPELAQAGWVDSYNDLRYMAGGIPNRLSDFAPSPLCRQHLLFAGLDTLATSATDADYTARPKAELRMIREYRDRHAQALGLPSESTPEWLLTEPARSNARTDYAVYMRYRP